MGTRISGLLFGLLAGAGAWGMWGGWGAGAHAQSADDRLVANLEVAGGGGRASMPMVEESLRITIDGQHATTRLRQVFRNDAGRIVEGRYTLRAGQGSRVRGFAYWNGEDKIVGEVFERRLAERIYGRVVSRRRDPGLLVQEGEGSFGFRIFPIQPGEDKRVELEYVRLLPRRGQRVEYRAPVSHPDASIRLDLRGHHIGALRSSTHRLIVERARGGLRVRAIPRDRPTQLVLSYAIETPAWRPAVKVHRDAGHDGYFVLTLAAPELPNRAVAPKDVTLVLDRSGSMAGEPMRQALSAAESIVARLPERDRVNVIAFDDDVDPLFARPATADAETRRTAIEFVRRMRIGGGTDLGLALERALAGQHDDDRPHVILFLTDGRSSAGMTLEAARADTRDARVFTVGLGPAVDRTLLSRLAALKRGRFTFIEDESAIERSVGDLYRQIDQPVLVNVSLSVEGAAARRVYPRTVPDLFAHDELRFSGRLRGEGTVRFILEGTFRGERVRHAVSARLPPAVHRPWVGGVWASARVDDLLEEIKLGGEHEELRNELIDLSVAYNFVTPYTAFLAIPEGEITAAVRGDMQRAREHKAEALRRLADARAVVAGAGGGRSAAARPSAGAPAGAPPFSPGQNDLMEDSLQSSLGDAEVYSELAEMSADGAEGIEGDGSPPRRYTVRSKHRGGCQSCSVGAPGSAPGIPGALAALALLACVRRLRARR